MAWKGEGAKGSARFLCFGFGNGVEIDLEPRHRNFQIEGRQDFGMQFAEPGDLLWVPARWCRCGRDETRPARPP